MQLLCEIQCILQTISLFLSSTNLLVSRVMFLLVPLFLVYALGIEGSVFFFCFFFVSLFLKYFWSFFLYLFLKHCHNLLNASHSRKACWSVCCHFLFPGGCEISDEFLHSLDLGSPKFPLTAFGELKLPALFFQMLLLLLTVLCESLLKINISQI